MILSLIKKAYQKRRMNLILSTFYRSPNLNTRKIGNERLKFREIIANEETFRETIITRIFTQRHHEYTAAIARGL